jgi:hypothetical protein
MRSTRPIDSPHEPHGQASVNQGVTITTIDPERSPDYCLWLEATRKEYELLDKTMGCWEVVDIDTLTQDANLIGVK